MDPANAEAPVYRGFLLLALAATLAVGTPLGTLILIQFWVTGDAVPRAWGLLHGSVQIFGFFATLLPGFAPHLFARFTGRPCPPLPERRLLALLAGGVALRVGGSAVGSAAAVLAGATAALAAFAIFAGWVWRALDVAPLAFLRRHLTLSTGWIVLALAVEVALRLVAVADGRELPDPGGIAATYAMGLLGGILGWMLGVLLRAGPMFVPNWAPRGALVSSVPWLLGLGTAIAAAGEALLASPAVARLGEGVALGTMGVVAVQAGGFRRPRGVLPLVSRSPEEGRFFRLALGSAAAAAVGSLVGSALLAAGLAPPLVIDAVRHLVTVGVLTAIFLAMAFRLVPVLERAPLPWPRLRRMAFAALLAAVVLRTAEVAVPFGLGALGPWLPLSGVLVWLALASLAANLLAVLVTPRSAP